MASSSLSSAAAAAAAPQAAEPEANGHNGKERNDEAKGAGSEATSGGKRKEGSSDAPPVVTSAPAAAAHKSNLAGCPPIPPEGDARFADDDDSSSDAAAASDDAEVSEHVHDATRRSRRRRSNLMFSISKILVCAFYATYGSLLLSRFLLRPSSRSCPPSSSDRWWCRGAARVLDATRAVGVPFVPATTTIGVDDSSAGRKERLAAGGHGAEEKEETSSSSRNEKRSRKRGGGNKVGRLFSRVFDPRGKRRAKKRLEEEEREAMREVVSKHAAAAAAGDEEGAGAHAEALVDRKHPVKHMVAEAAALFRRRKEKKREAAAAAAPSAATAEEEERRARRRAEKAEEWGKDAGSSAGGGGGDIAAAGGGGMRFELDGAKRDLIERAVSIVKDRVPDVSERGTAAGWGGPVDAGGRPWWSPPSPQKGKKSGAGAAGGDFLDRTEGARLAAAYLRIMHWPADLSKGRFPFKPCKKDGCDIDFAFAHTLEWREKYKPWCVTPAMRRENESGWIYVRGRSPADGDSDNDGHGHSVVWFRPGMHTRTDAEAYFRSILHALDSAVADNLRRSSDAVGRYNAVLDSTDFSLSQVPSLHEVKRAILMLQDHFPDKLGVLLIANLGGPAKLFLRMIMPLLAQEVRDKIHILPGSERGRLEMLNALVLPEYVPDWLGGPDDYRFDVNVAYGDGGGGKKGSGGSSRQCTDAEALEYITTMPYHA